MKKKILQIGLLEAELPKIVRQRARLDLTVFENFMKWGNTKGDFKN